MIEKDSPDDERDDSNGDKESSEAEKDIEELTADEYEALERVEETKLEELDKRAKEAKVESPEIVLGGEKFEAEELDHDSRDGVEWVEFSLHKNSNRNGKMFEFSAGASSLYTEWTSFTSPFRTQKNIGDEYTYYRVVKKDDDVSNEEANEIIGELGTPGD